MTSISFERRVCCYAKLFVRSRGGSQRLRRQECRRPSCDQFPIYVIAWLPLRQVNYTIFSWRCDELSIASARDAKCVGYGAGDTSSLANTVPRCEYAAKRIVSRGFDFCDGQRLYNRLVKVDQLTLHVCQRKPLQGFALTIPVRVLHRKRSSRVSWNWTSLAQALLTRPNAVTMTT